MLSSSSFDSYAIERGRERQREEDRSKKYSKKTILILLLSASMALCADGTLLSLDLYTICTYKGMTASYPDDNRAWIVHEHEYFNFFSFLFFSSRHKVRKSLRVFICLV